METDLQAFISLYKKLGIDCQVNHKGDSQKIYLAQDDHGGSAIFTVSDKFAGHSNFFSVVTFDLKGGFVDQSFWE